MQQTLLRTARPRLAHDQLLASIHVEKDPEPLTHVGTAVSVAFSTIQAYMPSEPMKDTVTDLNSKHHLFRAEPLSVGWNVFPLFAETDTLAFLIDTLKTKRIDFAQLLFLLEPSQQTVQFVLSELVTLSKLDMTHALELIARTGTNAIGYLKFGVANTIARWLSHRPSVARQYLDWFHIDQDVLNRAYAATMAHAPLLASIGADVNYALRPFLLAVKEEAWDIVAFLLRKGLRPFEFPDDQQKLFHDSPHIDRIVDLVAQYGEPPSNPMIRSQQLLNASLRKKGLTYERLARAWNESAKPGIYAYLAAIANGNYEQLDRLRERDPEHATEYMSELIAAGLGGKPWEEAAAELVKRGADVTWDNNAALRKAIWIENLPYAKWLVKHGANPRIDGEALLELAIKHGDEETIKTTIDAGADVTLDGNKFLYQASQKLLSRAVLWLVDAGGNVNHTQDFALRNFAVNGVAGTVRKLAARGADVHAKNDEALRLSARWGYTESVRALIELGADVHAMDDEALRKAASNGHLEIVKLLIKAGAHPRARKNAAIRWARDNKHDAVVEFLTPYCYRRAKKPQQQQPTTKPQPKCNSAAQSPIKQKNPEPAENWAVEFVLPGAYLPDTKSAEPAGCSAERPETAFAAPKTAHRGSHRDIEV